MMDDQGEIVVDIRSSDESTVHPANVVLIQALAIFCGSNSIYPYSHVVDWWVSRLEKDAELVRQGEHGGKYIFLLNNTSNVRQMVRHQRASFVGDELASRLSSMMEGYKKSYLDECWAPLNRLNVEEFTAQFLATSKCQMTWKVTAELRYQLRREIVDLIVPSYEVSLSALRGKGSRHSGVSNSLNGPMVGNKKQKKYTGGELEVEIGGLFEG
uniref:Exocyst subunit Exo70 family protein n=1 Tax=Triticum urartu TaxID=4572 RepID=A0A8R7P977_TRIUA